MFGREPRLPVDNMFPLCTESRGDYVQNVRQALDWAWNKATENSTKAREHQKRYYDKRVRGATLMIGDKVLVRNCSFDGPHKLHDKWSADIYTVKEQPDPRTPVFVVEPDNGGSRRTLHRNLLLSVESVREDNPDVSTDNQAVQKVPPSTRDNGTPKSSSATPKPVLREDGYKGTTSELEDGEDGGESDPDDDEFTILVPESNVQLPESRLCEPQPVNDFQPVAEEVPVVDQNSNNVPLQPPSNLSPPVPVPRRSVRPKQPPSWQTTGEFAFSIYMIR
ncbi:Pol polyprotein [Elysia marginata]|uniref:Pol polyprotein n=1 Tax=Elysia marginata TaxID=1093978 RepID=A0AAV4JT51_9GAST|nr:Pol polyprotein [Elysia marginata]